jgi:hypothetical protein
VVLQRVSGLKARAIIGTEDGAGFQPFRVMRAVFLGRCPRLG